ncbi:MAG: hypothetical protein ACOC0N_02675 [Chroococcales cyanobacterium]
MLWEQEVSHWSSQALGSALMAMAYSDSLNRQAFDVELYRFGQFALHSDPPNPPIFWGAKGG